jgi:O-antigen/teichoic acid export membrane protein
MSQPPPDTVDDVPDPTTSDTEPASEVPTTPLRKRALNSAAWSLGGFAIIQILRFGFNLVLTRLLFPEVFGLMALVDLFITGLLMFSDLGINVSVIRGARGDDPDFLNAAWSLQVVRGICLWLGACALAWPAAVAYGSTELLYLLPAAGLTTICHGLNSMAIFTCERHMLQGRLAPLQVGCYVVSMSIVVVCLLQTELGVWSLIVGRLAGSALEMISSHLLLPGRPCRFAWDRAVVSEIVHFGKWIFVTTGFTFLADQADRLIISSMTSLATFGVYNLAVQMALAAKWAMQGISVQVVFPYYSRVFQQGVGFPTSFRKIHPWSAGLGAFLTAGMVSTGPAFIDCLFKPDYEAAGWMLQLVALSAWIAILEKNSGCILWVLGNPRYQAIGMGAKLLASPLCAWAGYALAGLGGMIVGFAAAELLRYAVTVLALRDQRLPVLRYDLGLTGAVAATWMLTRWVDSLFAGPMQPALRLSVEMATVVLVWLGLAGIALWWPRRADGDNAWRSQNPA